MRILSCHIDNFGKLQNKTYDFEKECTIICEENGWGKSTLAAFLRVMLYGFMNEGKRDTYENERKRYKPWQKGVYGGSLCFEYCGTMYLLRRVFGDKSAEDEFHLICQDTNLESKDFTKNIGEEMFGINAEAFVRTVFITQNDCETKTTDGINAKIGNLAQNTDDINNYESAMKHLTDELNAMTPNRKTGSIARKKARLAQLAATLRTGEASIEQTIQETTARRDKTIGEREKLIERQRLLLEKQNEISAYKDLEAKQSKYRDLLEEYQRREEEVKWYRERFPGMVPKESEIIAKQLLCQENETAEREMEIYKLLPEEEQELEALCERFLEPLPERTEIEQLLELAQQYDRIVVRQMQTQLTPDESGLLKRLLEKYGGSFPLETEIAQISARFRTYTQLFNLQGAKQLSMQTIEAVAAEKSKNSMRKWYIVGMICGVVGIAFGGMAFATLETKIGVPIVLMSMVLGLVSGGLFFAGGRKKVQPPNPALDRIRMEIASDKEQMNQILADVEDFCQQYNLVYDENSFLDDLRQLQSDISRYQQLIDRQREANRIGEDNRSDEIRRRLEQFLLRNKETIDTQNGFYPLLLRCKEKLKRFCQLRDKKEAYELAYKRSCDNTRKVESFLNQYQIPRENDLREQLSVMLKEVREYEILANERNRAKSLLEQFSENEKIESLSAIQKPEQGISLEELADDLKVIAVRLEELYVIGKNYEERLEQLEDAMEEMKETRLEHDALQEEIQQDNLQYGLLVHTRDLLETAKSSFTNRYTEPLLKGFHKYYDLIGGTDSEFQMDANTNLQVLECSLPRDPMYFSTGKRDLIGICMRMALVEAMYGEEKPFLIMDDPFVNLDEERTRGGLALLEEIAKRYQVIYFTCHNSRC